MTELDLVPMTSALLEEAGNVGEPQLRTLDALHLVSALSIRAELTAFVAYDLRLAAAATAAALETLQPAPQNAAGAAAARHRR